MTWFSFARHSAFTIVPSFATSGRIRDTPGGSENKIFVNYPPIFTAGFTKRKLRVRDRHVSLITKNLRKSIGNLVSYTAFFSCCLKLALKTSSKPPKVQ